MALYSKNIQTETNKVVSVCIFFFHFEGSRGDKTQIFRTLPRVQVKRPLVEAPIFSTEKIPKILNHKMVQGADLIT